MNSTPFPPIRVFIADDSLVMREALRRVVESAPSLQVCGMAANGLEALERIQALQPDVVTLDIEMPLLNGIEVLKQIMRDSPRPVIMVSAQTQQGAELTLQALSIGAFDYVPKSEGGHALDPRKLRHELIAKIEAAAYSPLGRLHTPAAFTSRQQLTRFVVAPEIIAIGASTGGPRALQEIIPELPPDLPASIVIVQHMPPGFTGTFAERLNKISQLSVREAQDGDFVQPGTVYIAPAGKQISLKPPDDAAQRQENHTLTNTAISLSEEATGLLHKPSVDLMMLSVAEVFGRYSMGVILTGMGNDGLLGMSAISKVGGITIGQDQATSTVYSMPRACAENGVLQRVVPLPEIPALILEAVKYRGKHQEPERAGLARAAAHGTS